MTNRPVHEAFRTLGARHDGAMSHLAMHHHGGGLAADALCRLGQNHPVVVHRRQRASAGWPAMAGWEGARRIQCCPFKGGGNLERSGVINWYF